VFPFPSLRLPALGGRSSEAIYHIQIATALTLRDDYFCHSSVGWNPEALILQRNKIKLKV
jgi:hypothetical protein